MRETRARHLLAAEAARLGLLHRVIESELSVEQGDADGPPTSDIRGPAAGAVTLEHEILESLRVAVDDERAELAFAVVRLDAGTYGICVACGTAVPDERLEVVPATRFCVRCEAAGETTTPLPMIDSVLRAALREVQDWADDGPDEDDLVVLAAEEDAVHPADPVVGAAGGG